MIITELMPCGYHGMDELEEKLNETIFYLHGKHLLKPFFTFNKEKKTYEKLGGLIKRDLYGATKIMMCEN